MNHTSAALAALSLTVATAFAGIAPAPVDKGPVPAPPLTDPCAGPISYNNVELLYAYTDWDGPSDNGDSGVLRVEYSPRQNFYLALSGEYLDYESGHSWIATGGVGLYYPVSDNIHLAADGGAVYVRDEFDSFFSPVRGAQRIEHTNEEWGWYVRPHLRAKWGCLTVHAGAMYVDAGDETSFNDEWFGFANLYYQLAANWDITAGVRHGDDATTWSGGVRWRY